MNIHKGFFELKFGYSKVSIIRTVSIMCTVSKNFQMTLLNLLYDILSNDDTVWFIVMFNIWKVSLSSALV